jgi:hypothetical protein
VHQLARARQLALFTRLEQTPLRRRQLAVFSACF